MVLVAEEGEALAAEVDAVAPAAAVLLQALLEAEGAGVPVGLELQRRARRAGADLDLGHADVKLDDARTPRQHVILDLVPRIGPAAVVAGGDEAPDDGTGDGEEREQPPAGDQQTAAAAAAGRWRSLGRVAGLVGHGAPAGGAVVGWADGER